MYFLYILQSVKYKKSYVGITNDLKRKLEQHNQGDHLYTKRYAPWVIIYTELTNDRISAHKREIYLKSTTGRRWMKKNIFIKADVAELVYAQS